MIEERLFRSFYLFLESKIIRANINWYNKSGSLVIDRVFPGKIMQILAVQHSGIQQLLELTVFCHISCI
jgi:hypothetical protein